MQQSVSVIIPVYKRTEWLNKCLNALSGQNFEGRCEIVVVDDGSPNNADIVSVVETARLTCPWTVIFYSQVNSGPAFARNRGVALSTGDILCFLDDDSVPMGNWLAEITRAFVENPTVSIVSGRTCSYDRQSPLPLLIEQAVYPAKSWATCNIAYRRTVFEKLGGFDVNFREPSWEDNDLGLRARWAGYEHCYTEKAIVHHPHESSLAEFVDKCLLNGRGAAAFSRKYFWRKTFWAVAAPILIARRLVYGLYPSVWLRPEIAPPLLKFYWSLYSLKGFIGAFFSGTYGKNQTG